MPRTLRRGERSAPPRLSATERRLSKRPWIVKQPQSGVPWGMHLHISVFCLAASSALFSGCVGTEHRALNVFDPCLPIALVPAEDATAIERSAVASAAARWRETAAAQIEVDGDAESRVPVRFRSASLAFYGYYEDADAAILINRDLIDPTALEIAIAHELGHAFGLLHVTGRRSVMNSGNLTVGPNSDDAAALQALWGSCRQADGETIPELAERTP